MKLNRLFSFFISICMLMSVCAYAADYDRIISEYNSVSSYLINTVKTPVFSQIGGEWTVLALARGDASVNDGYFADYYKNIEQTVKETDGIISKNKYTEYSRLIIALTAIGKDAEDVGGYNLVKYIEDYDSTVWQGLNGAVYALIALESAGSGDKELKDRYIDFILKRQLADGGFALASNATESEPDMTGIVLQALSKHTLRADVSASIEKALAYLSKAQNDKGGYVSWDSENSENVSQVIVALCELGIGLDDARFVKNGKNLLDALLEFKMADGGFEHIKGSGYSDLMASEQCAYALAALKRASEGKTSLYDMSDVRKIETADKDKENNTIVTIKPVTMSGRTFDDIKGHKNQIAVEKLAEREIINGKSEALFYPDDTMTRAEFATIVVKALGLKISEKSVFSDVADNSWYKDYVNTAYSYGIVNGVSETEFAPESTITKEMAAVMLVRAANLCGNETTVNADEIRNVLSQFGDYMSASEWAKESLAYCYKTKILSDEDFEINHHSLVKRCEIAQMIYNMLSYSKLI